MIIDTWRYYSIVDTPDVHLWSCYPLYIINFQMSRGGELKIYSLEVSRMKGWKVFSIVFAFRVQIPCMKRQQLEGKRFFTRPIEIASDKCYSILYDIFRRFLN
jgi:hypothetical protein